jgi:hypothetical protein
MYSIQNYINFLRILELFYCSRVINSGSFISYAPCFLKCLKRNNFVNNCEIHLVHKQSFPVAEECKTQRDLYTIFTNLFILFYRLKPGSRIVGRSGDEQQRSVLKTLYNTTQRNYIRILQIPCGRSGQVKDGASHLHYTLPT